MRMHIELDDDLAERIDRIAGKRGRSRFVREAIALALEQAERWNRIRSSRGAVSDTGHDWDDDPAAWVTSQRNADARRVG